MSMLKINQLAGQGKRSGVSLKIKGMKSVKNYLQNQKRMKQQAVNRAIHNAGLKVEGEVKQSIAGRKSEPTSVDTGRFLNSVNTDNEKEFVSIVKTNVPYAKYLEYGTSRIAPRRHFQNSLARMSNEIKDMIRKALK